MKVIITGATGFIGSLLCPVLSAAGYDVIALTRNVAKGRKTLGNTVTCVEWDAKSAAGWESQADGAHAIINLAGANIAGGLWTESYKQTIRNSRIQASEAVCQAIENATVKPRLLLQGSASGFYGDRGEAVLDEKSAKGDGFLADVVAEWEASVREVAASGIRVCYLRTGVVLGKNEGILDKLSLPFKFFLGGAPGNGKQWFSWIHVEDEVNIIKFLLETESAQGIYNLVAPDPVPMGVFCKQMGKVMNRPSWMPVPAFALKLVMGQMAEETALVSQRILPRRLMENGFRFAYPSLVPALQDLLD